ncbi:hypothetical protein HHI36_007797 [Cryptolaemus montrouzieri]|uniref:Uncharacterized protein n=1 Tax=Cryptolaemus montrouzieri TaxID=559131 RepID=A0ABD2MQQ4_9CUCU
MSSRAAKILALAIFENKQATEKIVQEKNYCINFDDELANASCLEMINFSEIDENLLDIPIIFQLAQNNDDTNYLLQFDDGCEKNSPDCSRKSRHNELGVRHKLK